MTFWLAVAFRLYERRQVIRAYNLMHLPPALAGLVERKYATRTEADTAAERLRANKCVSLAVVMDGEI